MKAMKDMFRRMLIVTVIVLVASLALAMTVFAQTPTSDPGTGLPIFATFWDFLAWAITGPGLVWLVGMFLSTVLAKFVWWNKLNGDIKVAVTILLPFVVLIPGVLAALHFGIIVAADVPNQVLTALWFYFATQWQFGRLQRAGLIRTGA